MRPIFIDFEASSLTPNSWPIEIGLACLEALEVHLASRLIRPDPGWSPDTWSLASTAVHGIPRTALDVAKHAANVARWAIAMIRHRTPVSDAPAFDQRWLGCLLATEPSLARPVIVDFDAAAARRFRRPALVRVYERLDHLPTPHRAEADARRLAHAWLAGSRSV